MKDIKSMNDKELLESLKEDVTAWFNYWQDNILAYHKANNFIFYSNLSTDEKKALNDLQRPSLEFNVLEAYQSRLIGEFSKQEPNFSVRSAPDAQQYDPRLPEILEGYLESTAQESKKEGTETKIYRDMLSGGYSVGEVFYEYESPTSFNENIKFRKLKDPTMCGFDPLAQDMHKGDGRYYFRVFPMSEREFKATYPNADISGISFKSNNVSKFSFSYKAKNENIIAVCVYYTKIKTKKKIVYLADNSTMSMSSYNKMIKGWDQQGFIEQPPKILKTRMTEFTEIVRFDFIENQILERSPTLYTQLPGVFFDGNSAEVRYNDGQDDLKQIIRAYWKNAEGAQKLKNLAGQSWANEIESIVMHKFKTPKEAIPPGYETYYINNQRAGVLVYNAFMPDGETPIPAPQEIARQPIPPEVPAAFTAADQAIQNCLGSYDAQLGINDNQLSGVAVVEAATQSNAAAMPYVVNYMTSFSQVSKIIVGLIPKVMKNPRKIQVINKKRKKDYVQINSANGVSFNFDPNMMNVIVEAGTNFEVQKNKSLQMLDLLSKSFSSMAQLINTKGLPILLDNMSFRGSDQLKVLAEEMMQEQQAAAQNQPQMPNPMQLKAQELQLKNQQLQQEYQLESQKIQNQRMDMALKSHLQGRQDAIDLAKMQTEAEVNREKNDNDLAISHAKIVSDHSISHAKNMLHAIDNDNKMFQSLNENAQNNAQQSPAPSQLTSAPENPNH